MREFNFLTFEFDVVLVYIICVELQFDTKFVHNKTRRVFLRKCVTRIDLRHDMLGWTWHCFVSQKGLTGKYEAPLLRYATSCSKPSISLSISSAFSSEGVPACKGSNLCRSDKRTFEKRGSKRYQFFIEIILFEPFEIIPQKIV